MKSYTSTLYIVVHCVHCWRACSLVPLQCLRICTIPLRARLIFQKKSHWKRTSQFDVHLMLTNLTLVSNKIRLGKGIHLTSFSLRKAIDSHWLEMPCLTCLVFSCVYCFFLKLWLEFNNANLMICKLCYRCVEQNGTVMCSISNFEQGSSNYQKSSLHLHLSIHLSTPRDLARKSRVYLDAQKTGWSIPPRNVAQQIWPETAVAKSVQ